MAASGSHEAVESEWSEFLEEEKTEEEEKLGTGSPPLSCGVLGTLSFKVEDLEHTAASQQEEIQGLKSEVADLKQDRKGMADAELRAKKARSYAAMAAERAAITMERDEALLEAEVEKERRRQVGFLLERAEAERNAIEKKYQEKLEALSCSHNKQNNKLKLLEEEIKQVKAENEELKRKNNFLRATVFEVNPNVNNRHRLKCFSCMQGYSVEPQTGEACTFHPLPPVPPSVWHRWEHSHLNKYRWSENKQYFYWSCCNTLAAKGRRPCGCRRGPHHQKWEMDILMKRVMLSPDVLNENDEPKDPQII